MPYTDLLATARIVHLVEPGSRDHVLDAAARLLSGGTARWTGPIADGLRAREAVGSTGIGRGVAIPHCRAECGEILGAFLRLQTPVDWEAPDGDPVDLLFVLIVPIEETSEHLRVLGGLAERFHQPEFCSALRNATSNEDLYQTAVEF